MISKGRMVKSHKATVAQQLRSAVWCGIILVAGISGCAPDTTGLGQLFEVTGEVSYNGEPTPGAIIEFVPKDEVADTKPNTRALDAPRTFAVVDGEGKFSVKTMVPEGAKTGAPLGDYLISITWMKPIDPTDKDSSLGPNLLPEKYRDPKTSLLEFEVTSGTNTVPAIDLEK